MTSTERGGLAVPSIDVRQFALLATASLFYHTQAVGAAQIKENLAQGLAAQPPKHWVETVRRPGVLKPEVLKLELKNEMANASNHCQDLYPSLVRRFEAVDLQEHGYKDYRTG